MLKTWKDLDDSRRGWALGSVIGILSVTLTYRFIPTSGEVFLSTALYPCHPRDVGWRSGFTFFIVFFPSEENLTATFLALSLGGFCNYCIWGAYGSLVMRTAPAENTTNLKVFFFALLCFFVSIFGMSYSLSRGMSYLDGGAGHYLLVAAFILFMLASALLYAFVSNKPPSDQI